MGRALQVGRTVFIRHPSGADREEFLRLMRASKKLHRPWVSPPTTEEEFDGLIRRGRDGSFEALLVCLLENGAIAGVYELSQISYGAFQSAYLGYFAAAPYAGRGYMREGLELVLRYVFDTLKLHRIEANVQPGNARSVALVRGAGFGKEGYSPRYLKIGGRWRDHERWAILAEDWSDSRRRGRPRGLRGGSSR